MDYYKSSRRSSNNINESGVPKCKAFQDEWEEGFQEGFLEGIRESVSEKFQNIDPELIKRESWGLSPEAAQSLYEKVINQGIELMTYLIRDGRMDEYYRNIDDSDYRRTVLKEYGLL